MFISANRKAQTDGDTGANEARRIQQRESEVKIAWRTYVFHNDANPTAEQLATATGYPTHYITFVCGNIGYQLS